jgi:hypothetical protein
MITLWPQNHRSRPNSARRAVSLGGFLVMEWKPARLVRLAKIQQRSVGRSIGIFIPTSREISIFPQDLQDDTTVLFCKKASPTANVRGTVAQ